MMKSSLLILVFVFFTAYLNGQPRKTYKVNPGEKVLQVLPAAAVYLYPQFENAVVKFKNGRLGLSKLNYNRLLDEIQFIDNKGDTVSLADEETISFIKIGSDTFYYYQGFVKKMDEVEAVKFANKKFVALLNKQKIGGMGELSSASIDTYERMSTSQGAKDIVQKEILTFAEYTNFFIGDAYNHFKPLNKKSLLNAFYKKPGLEKYLVEKKVDLLKEEDITKLIAFLKTL